jgi:CARDB
MKRIFLTGVVVLAAGSALIPSAAGADTPHARLRSMVCQRALDPPARAVGVTAVMRPLPGTRRMELRFDLLGRGPQASAFSAVRGGDLGAWLSPHDPTLGRRSGDVWNLSHPVVDLVAPATYRFRVSYRWIGARGKVLGSAVRLSPSCYQPELRPDLIVQSLVVKPIAGRPKLDQYVAVIRNNGLTASGPFAVLFSPGGTATARSRGVPSLAPKAKIRESFTGPACTSALTPTVTADPNDQVDDFNRANNSLSAVCSAP